MLTAIYTSCILFVFIFCYINCFLFNVCFLFHFFNAIVKFCVVFVVGIIKRAISVKYNFCIPIHTFVFSLKDI